MYVHLQVTTYHCAECFKKERVHVSDTFFEKHIGLGFECSMCGKIFNRPDIHGNGYDGSELDLKKRSTRTFTEQESEEYRNFMREINKNIFITKEKQTIMTPKDQTIKQQNRKKSHQRNWSAGHPQKKNRGIQESQIIRKQTSGTIGEINQLKAFRPENNPTTANCTQQCK